MNGARATARTGPRDAAAAAPEGPGCGLRIAMVSEHASPLAAVGGVDAGGQNVHVEALARHLAQRGHRVDVYTRRDDPDLPETVRIADGVEVHHVPAGPARHVPKDDLLPWMPDFGHWLADRFAGEPPDLVHAHFWMSGLASLIARRESGVPVVQTFHALGTVKRRHQGTADTSPPERIRIEAAIAHDVDHVVATCSDEVFELLPMGADRRRVSIVPCGVDLGVFTEHGPVAPRGPMRRLLSLGRLVERKGVDIVVRALPALPGTELVIAGGPGPGELDTDPEARRLLALATELGVADRVRFHGSVPRPDVPALIRSADVVVCTPWYEPFGIVPLEAMACGRPVVAAAVGGLVDTVADDITGVLVPPRDPQALAGALRRLLDNPFRLDALGQAALDRVRLRYGWARVAAETEAAYRRTLAATGVTARAEVAR